LLSLPVDPKATLLPLAMIGIANTKENNRSTPDAQTPHT
jgi:hypothetical protein